MAEQTIRLLIGSMHLKYLQALHSEQLGDSLEFLDIFAYPHPNLCYQLLQKSNMLGLVYPGALQHWLFHPSSLQQICNLPGTHSFVYMYTGRIRAWHAGWLDCNHHEIKAHNSFISCTPLRFLFVATVTRQHYP